MSANQLLKAVLNVSVSEEGTDSRQTPRRMLLVWMIFVFFAYLPDPPRDVRRSTLSNTQLSAESAIIVSTSNYTCGKAFKTSTSSITAIGYFTNIKYSGEHGYGYAVELWQQGSNIFGLISAQNGLAGDPPAGILEDVKFNRKSRILSFKARLSTSVVYSKQYNGVPSRDVFKFNGILNKHKLTGTLEISNILFPSEAPQYKKINLSRSIEMSGWMLTPQDYTDWKKQIDKILRLRGPKW